MQSSWYESPSIFHLHLSRFTKMVLFSFKQLQVMKESPPRHPVMGQISPWIALSVQSLLTSPLSRFGGSPHLSSVQICQNFCLEFLYFNYGFLVSINFRYIFEIQ